MGFSGFSLFCEARQSKIGRFGKHPEVHGQFSREIKQLLQKDLPVGAAMILKGM